MLEAVDIYLASKSPRRRELLEQIGVRYQCVDVDVPEQRGASESPEQYVLRLAASKARAGSQKLCSSKPVLGSDTIVVIEQQVLEKPVDEDHGVSMLLSLSGRVHRVLTAVSLCVQGECETRIQSTAVRFRCITEQEARAYWCTGEPHDKAGGYAIQGFGAVFIEHIEGSYSGVMGLPLLETAQLLQQFGVGVWNELSLVTKPFPQ